jgi:pimeloyl-ACP methyl ester carboxylesterase
VVLVGHSFGGGATIETALLIPDRVQALVLADVGGIGFHRQSAEPGAQPALVHSVLGIRPLRHAIIASTITNPLLSKKILQTLILDPADATQERIEILQQPLVLKQSTDTLGEWLRYTLASREVSLSSDPANYQRLSMPTLLVWGENDTTIPLAEGEYLNSLLPNSQLQTMQQVNHIPQIEEPAAFNKLLVDFLGATLPQRR